MEENWGRELGTPELEPENAMDPASAIALAAALFNEPGREADVESAYGRAIRSRDPDLAPAAAYGLGLLLARFPDRFDEAAAIKISKEVGYKGLISVEASRNNGPDPYASVQTVVDELVKDV